MQFNKSNMDIIAKIRQLQKEGDGSAAHDIEIGWQKAARQHSNVLWSILSELGVLWLNDYLAEPDDGEPSTREYISHYHDYDLRRVWDEINDAADGIQYLRGIIGDEIKKRSAEKRLEK